jgi:hypothetical protein
VDSHVLAADYRPPDPGRWSEAMADLPGLRRLGAHRVIVYRSIEDPARVFTTFGIHHREPLDTMLRSGVILDWFKEAGVEDIPPMFVGTVLDRIDLGAAPPDVPPSVVVAAIAPVGDVPGFLERIHGDLDSFRASGVRKVWIYQALDNGQEVMILQEIESEPHASRWLRHPEALGRWMEGAGVGVYPPIFVGRLEEVIDPR